MNNQFLNEVESNIHKQAKEKLFYMLSNGLEIIDQYNENYRYEYDIFDDEFLHMESPILNFKNSVLYSNKKVKLPCYKYLKFNYSKNKNLLCNQRGRYGNIAHLPCKECIESNCDNKLLNVGFIPDISYGYNGKHRVWFEINYTHPATLYKMCFCYIKNIKLFEFESEYILNLDADNRSLKTKRFSVREDDDEEAGRTKTYIFKHLIDQFIDINVLKILNKYEFKNNKHFEYFFNKIVAEYNIDLSKVKIKGKF